MTEATAAAGVPGRPSDEDAPVRSAGHPGPELRSVTPFPVPPVDGGTGERLNPAHRDTRYGKDLLDAVTKSPDPMGADAE